MGHMDRTQPPADGEVRILTGISQVPATEWDALFAHEPELASPFLRHAFLSALEESGSVTASTGWTPRHLLLRRDGRLVAAAPAYLKEGSEGDFSRDWAWASAAADRDADADVECPSGSARGRACGKSTPQACGGEVSPT